MPTGHSFFFFMDGQLLDVNLIREGRAAGIVGSQIIYVEEVDSTNRVAREALDENVPNGLVVVTDNQIAGRGRQGRVWSAPPRSSLLMSVVLDVPPGTQAGDLVMLGALSVFDAIGNVTGLALSLKWPNDVLVADRKVCGILAETFGAPARRRAIVGIGINCNFDQTQVDGIPPTATTLQRELGAPVVREKLATALFDFMNVWYRLLTEDHEAVFEAWQFRLGTVGQVLTVQDSDRIWRGVGIGVNRDGALVVQDETGLERTVYAADVSIRPR